MDFEINYPIRIPSKQIKTWLFSLGAALKRAAPYKRPSFGGRENNNLD